MSSALSFLVAIVLAGSALHAQTSPVQGSPVTSGSTGSADAPPTMAPLLDDIGYAGVLPGEGGAIVAAHRSLPIGSYAEITSLASGKTIVVRIVEQGAFGKGRVVDLSCAAVQQLDLSAIPAPIRVRRAMVPEQEQAMLNAGRPLAERLASPPGLLSVLRRKLPPVPAGVEGGSCALAAGGSDAAPAVLDARPARGPSIRPPKKAPAAKAPSVKAAPPMSLPILGAPPVVPKPKPAMSEPMPPAPVFAPHPAIAAGPGFAIQVAALSNRSKANSLAHSLGGYVETAGAISRVRKGPFATEAAARAALSQIRAKGFADARVITNEGR